MFSKQLLLDCLKLSAANSADQEVNLWGWDFKRSV